MFLTNWMELLVKVTTVEWSCSECGEKLCDLCQKAHIRVKLTKNHSLVSLNKET